MCGCECIARIRIFTPAGHIGLPEQQKAVKVRIDLGLSKLSNEQCGKDADEQLGGHFHNALAFKMNVRCFRDGTGV